MSSVPPLSFNAPPQMNGHANPVYTMDPLTRSFDNPVYMQPVGHTVVNASASRVRHVRNWARLGQGIQFCPDA